MEKTRESYPKIHFYNAEHTDGNIDAVWEEIRDADFIFLELISNEVFRQYVQDIINYGAGVSDPLEKAKAVRHLESVVDKKLLVDIGSRIIYTGKEICFIDVTEGEESQIEAEDAFRHFVLALKARRAGDIESSFSEYVLFADLLAQSSRKREDITADEIQALIDMNIGQLAGKKVAVVQGAIHTRVFHKIKKDNPDMTVTRSFPENDYYFPSNHSLVRRIIFGKRLAEDDYKRAYISALFITEKLLDSKGFEMTDREIYKKSAAIADKISPEDLQKLWGQLKAGKLDLQKTIEMYY
jgi:hypothetical protein